MSVNAVGVGPDLTAVNSVRGLAAQLRMLRIHAGNPSLRRLEKWGRERPGAALPRSSVADALAGERLPALRLFLVLVEALGVPAEGSGPWRSAWERVASGSRRDADPQVLATGGTWRFDDQRPVTIACSELPAELRERMPYASLTSPDYAELYSFADPDALIELYGHLRASNPASDIRYRKVAALTQADYAEHLVLLGGVDWNSGTRDLLSRIDVPVRQIGRAGVRDEGYFEVTEGPERRQFRPVVRGDGVGRVVLEDVAHFFRGPNPFNPGRTITMCNGMYGSGTLGVVRALTDPQFRDGNESYLRSRFHGADTLSLLARIKVGGGRAITPNWLLADTRLHEYGEPLTAGS